MSQGVNSALEDIVVLNKTLDECNDDLTKALPLYEERRMPDIKALIKIMQFAFPYQYNQDALGKNLWMVNFAIRIGLNKLMPFLFSPPAFMMVQDPSLSYSQILECSEQTTKVSSRGSSKSGRVE